MGSVISLILTVLGLLFLHPILRFLNVPDHLTGTRQAVYLYYYRRYAGNVSL
jgi:Na+-driven multidrug efflux pump